jgi:hypothetical protein
MMGEIAEAMLDGTMCECCGEYIGSDAGYPQYCSDQCAHNRGISPDLEGMSEAVKKYARLFPCDICDKRLRTVEGVEQHKRAKHDTEEP